MVKSREVVKKRWWSYDTGVSGGMLCVYGPYLRGTAFGHRQFTSVHHTRTPPTNTHAPVAARRLSLYDLGDDDSGLRLDVVLSDGCYSGMAVIKHAYLKRPNHNQISPCRHPLESMGRAGTRAGPPAPVPRQPLVSLRPSTRPSGPAAAPFRAQLSRQTQAVWSISGPGTNLFFLSLPLISFLSLTNFVSFAH